MVIGDPVRIKDVFGRVTAVKEGGAHIEMHTPHGTLVTSGLLWVKLLRSDEEFARLRELEDYTLSSDGKFYGGHLDVESLRGC